MATPWAYFFAPQKFKFRRRSPFTSFRIVPTLGSLEEQNECEQTLEHLQCKTADEEKERAAILSCFKQIDKINGWLGYITGRIGQFLQG